MTSYETPEWAALITRIQASDAAAMDELYRIFAKGFRAYLWSRLGGQDVDDHLHEVYLIVIQAIQRGEIREPERLMGYVHSVARYWIAGQIKSAVRARTFESAIEPSLLYISDRGPGPERQAIEKQDAEIAAQALAAMRPREREVLSRFYLDGQSAERICGEMDLSETQFRLLKSRSKARYGKRARLAMSGHA